MLNFYFYNDNATNQIYELIKTLAPLIVALFIAYQGRIRKQISDQIETNDLIDLRKAFCGIYYVIFQNYMLEFSENRVEIDPMKFKELTVDQKIKEYEILKTNKLNEIAQERGELDKKFKFLSFYFNKKEFEIIKHFYDRSKHYSAYKLPSYIESKCKIDSLKLKIKEENDETKKEGLIRQKDKIKCENIFSEKEEDENWTDYFKIYKKDFENALSVITNKIKG